jgi:hypothetical protein
VTPTAEQGLASPSARNHSQVSNCNLALRNVHRLLVNADEPVWVSYISNEIATAVATTGTNSYETATSTDGGVTEAARIAFLETYLESTTCLPAKMVEQISADSADLAAWTSIASVSAAALAHAPTVSNVEDESDLQFIFKMLTERMEKIRECQITNDREQQRIHYVRETSECNQAFHQVEFDRLTGFNDAEVDARYAAGAQMAADLDVLKGQHSVTKQTFFNDITLKGCCW